MKKSNYVFCSHLSLDDCIERITNIPWEFEDTWDTTALFYNCQTISPNSLRITFTGGQFRRFRRTEYMMIFSVQEQTTVVEVCFHKEMWGLPPMTSDREIDAFMDQKIQAKRIEG